MKKIIIQNSKYAKEQEVGIMPLTMANIGEVNEIKRIGGNEEIATDDACQMEHVISRESFNAIKEYVRTH